MPRLRRLLALNREERGVLLRSLVLLTWVRWTVSTRGLAAVEARIERVMLTNNDTARVRVNRCREPQIVRLMLAAQRALPWRVTCLHLAAALKGLLAERGIASDLRLGVRNEHGKFLAHAWLERDGRVLVGGKDVHERYAAFPLIRRIGRI